MAIKECNLSGVYIIDGMRFPDNRGELVKPFSVSLMPAGINVDFKETWFTKSKKDVIRGMHLQVEPAACEKLVSVIVGTVLDVLLDLRENSPTYGGVYSIELDGEDTKAIYIPKGVAHGYRVLKDSVVMYMATEVNVSKYDVGIRWNSFGYDWGIETPILSDKDAGLPLFDGIDT
ncbi:MAG: dTDP-4-dehydrorhamnose 3,5-epimerase family protein [Ruminococcus sp.]|nr:dTDP-4-dehydrorhamnose 3,5-epimerase family protein [Ruminococcus sp.]